MPNDYTSGVEVGAGLVSRALQLKTQREAVDLQRSELSMQQALMPLKVQEMEAGLQAQAFKLKTMQDARKLDLDNLEGASKLAETMSSYAPDDPWREYQMWGVAKRYPGLIGTKAFQDGLDQIKASQLAEKQLDIARMNYNARIESAQIDAAARTSSLSGTHGYAPSNIEKEWKFAEKLRSDADALEAEGKTDEANRLRQEADAVVNKSVKDRNLTPNQKITLLNSGGLMRFPEVRAKLEEDLKDYVIGKPAVGPKGQPQYPENDRIGIRHLIK